MIDTKLEFSEGGKTLVLTIIGHAGMGDAGNDPVCAAASILAYTVAQEVTDMHKAGKLKKEPHIRLDAGDASVTCKPTKSAYAEALHLYKVAQTGYRLLAHNFPDNLRIKKFGEA